MAVDPSEALYVGDLFPVDVLGSQKAGLQAVLMDPYGLLDYPVDRLPDVGALPAYLQQLSYSP
jgi:FMN phosphatase YigB (HAD superfamily)